MSYIMMLMSGILCPTIARVDNRFTQYPIRRSKASLTQEEKQLDLNLSDFL